MDTHLVLLHSEDDGLIFCKVFPAHTEIRALGNRMKELFTDTAEVENDWWRVSDLSMT